MAIYRPWWKSLFRGKWETDVGYKCWRGVMYQSSHIERTRNIERQEDITSAIVKSISQESKTVKKLTLAVENVAFLFKPGQWVDFFIPGISTIGGFSMCSAPWQLKENRELELAVKYSTHPPAYWVHTKCQNGDKVLLRVGGNFYYDPSTDVNNKNLLLIAGGVGINPLFSILQHAHHTSLTATRIDGTIPKVMLLFSAKYFDELLFKKRIDKIVSENDAVSCKYYITGTSKSDCQPEDSLQASRIDQDALMSAVESLGTPEQTLCYICGPPPMIEDVSKSLKAIGFNNNSIRYEKWW